MREIAGERERERVGERDWESRERQIGNGRGREVVRQRERARERMSKIESMRGSRIFVRGGGPGLSDKKSPDNVFLFFFFSPQLILQKSNG